jgi:hypothetical protein
MPTPRTHALRAAALVVLATISAVAAGCLTIHTPPPRSAAYEARIALLRQQEPPRAAVADQERLARIEAQLAAIVSTMGTVPEPTAGTPPPAVQRFGIEGDLAKPTSLVIDRAGIVQFSYIGKRPDDRPSARALLDELDRLQ